jgi:hypothetical protein
MMNLALDTKEQVLEAAIGGLPRVAQAVVAIPAEAGQEPLTRLKTVTAKRSATWILVRRKFRNGSRQSCFVCERKWPRKS